MARASSPHQPRLDYSMASSSASSAMKIGLAQVAPVLFEREATLAKIIEHVRAAAGQGCRLVAFGEALVPGYPVWIERTDGARFNADDQKRLHALYASQAVQPEAGHLDGVLEAAHDGGIAVILGTIERAADRGGHSLYCSRIFIEPDGTIASIHRKLMPTYEERLTWAIGDGAGLVVHRLGPFTVGALNCWENWMPLARTALYALGEDLHVALWPGTNLNTTDITRFIARESRSYVCSVSGLIREQDVPADVPVRSSATAARRSPAPPGSGSSSPSPTVRTSSSSKSTTSGCSRSARTSTPAATTPGPTS